jgi:hypothetical protein
MIKPDSSLEDIDRLLDNAGIPIGNEHELYSTLKRVDILRIIKEYEQSQADKLRLGYLETK